MASKALTITDNNIIDAFAYGWTAEEIEKRYSIPAVKALKRLKEIVTARTDIFTTLEERFIVLHKARQLLEDAEKNLDPGDPKAVDARLKVIRTVSELLEKQSAYSDEELERATRAQAGLILQVVEAGYNKARELLAEEYGNVDLVKIDEAFRLGMAEAREDATR